MSRLHVLRAGVYRRCPDAVAIGLQTATGGFGEHAVVPEQQVHRLPDGVSLSSAALVEPLAVGLHAVRRSRLRAGDTVAIFGAGTIGLSVAWAADRAGATAVLVSEPSRHRRRTALDIGADETIDPREIDPVESACSRTVDGVDVAFEFAGISETVYAAIRSTRREERSSSVATDTIADLDLNYEIETRILDEDDLASVILETAYDTDCDRISWAKSDPQPEKQSLETSSNMLF